MKQMLEQLRDKASRRGVQFMDVRLFETDRTSISVQDRRADKISQGRSTAAGVRVLNESAWGFASSEVTDAASLERCLDAALAMAAASRVKVGEPGVVGAIQPVVDTVRAAVERSPQALSLQEKMQRVLAYEQHR